MGTVRGGGSSLSLANRINTSLMCLACMKITMQRHANGLSVRILKCKFKLEFIPQPHDADSLLPVWGHETLQAYLVGSTAAV